MMAMHQQPVRLAIAAACATAVISGCTPAPSTGAPATSTPAASTSSASSAPTSDSSSASSSPSADAVTIDITVRDGQVTPNGKKFDVTKGQTVVLRVTSDVEEEVHAHNARDGYELEVRPGTPARGQFVAADPGTFEVELHHLDKIVAILVVR